MFKVIDNFLEKEHHENLLKLFNDDFPWYYNQNISFSNPNTVYNKYLSHSNYSYGFFHVFCDENGFRENIWANSIKHVINKIMRTINKNRVLRARADMTLASPNNHEHDAHVDFEYDNIATILYMNESDGDTIFFDKKFNDKEKNLFLKDNLKETKRVSPKPNRLLIFEGNLIHTGCSPKMNKNRILINSNYI